MRTMKLRRGVEEEVVEEEEDEVKDTAFRVCGVEGHVAEEGRGAGFQPAAERHQVACNLSVCSETAPLRVFFGHFAKKGNAVQLWGLKWSI